MVSAVSRWVCAASRVTRAGSPPGIPAVSRRVPAWVISLVPSGTLTCAIVTASRWSIAEKSVTLSFSSVHAPRNTFPSSAMTHSPSPSFRACAESHFPVILSSSAASILVSTFRIVDSLGYLQRSLNQHHSVPAFPAARALRLDGLPAECENDTGWPSLRIGVRVVTNIIPEREGHLAVIRECHGKLH